MPAGTRLRVHPYPRRYPACYATDWHAAVIHLDDDLLVLNKPVGLPCMPHESNAAEHVAACAAAALGLGTSRSREWAVGTLEAASLASTREALWSRVQREEGTTASGCLDSKHATSAFPDHARNASSNVPSNEFVRGDATAALVSGRSVQGGSRLVDEVGGIGGRKEHSHTDAGVDNELGKRASQIMGSGRRKERQQEHLEAGHRLDQWWVRQLQPSVVCVPKRQFNAVCCVGDQN
jgi:hypothetical protein